MTTTLTRDFKIGFVAIAAVFVLYFGMNFLKGIDIFSSTNQYTGAYDNLGGLVPSAPVMIKGMKVGQVEAVDYDFQRSPAFRVSISVNRHILLPTGTQMVLADNGLMGGKAIFLQLPPLGHEGEGIYLDDAELPTLTDAGLMGELTEELLPKINSAMGRVDSLLASVQGIVASPAIQNSLQSIETTTSELAAASGSLNTFMRNDVPALADNLTQITSDFAVVGSELKNIDFADLASSVDTTLNNLQDLTTKINDKDGTLGLLLNDTHLYHNLTHTVSSADSLLIDLKTNPKRYVHFSLFGRKEK